MIQLKKVLLPTDFSDCSQEALKYAISMSAEFGADLVVLHVINQQLLTEGLNLPRVGSFQDLETEMAKEAERQMDAFLKENPDLEEIRHQRLIRLGRPFLEIIGYAKDNAVDLIVIGTHGRSGIEHIIFGSTAEKVVRKAPCPVLTVKPAQREFVVP